MSGEVAAALRFRVAKADDVDAIVALVTSAYRGDASRQGWTTEADFLDGNRIDAEVLHHDIERPRSRVLLAERDGKLFACAHIAIEHSDDGLDAGYFGMFSVRPHLQGAGIGKAMLDEAERIVRDEWQMPVMRMTVIDIRDELIAFYQRRGYRRTGVFKPFPYGDARYGIPLRDDLRFEVLEKPLQETKMSGWVRVCAMSELLPGESKVVWDGETPILVLNYDGDFYALEDRCSHEDFELSAGVFDGEEATIECVLHGSKFDVRDGRALNAPAYAPVAKFPVKVEDDAVWTRDDRD